MIAYHVKYTTQDSDTVWARGVDARNLASAKKKIERQERKSIKIVDYSVIGYY